MLLSFSCTEIVLLSLFLFRDDKFSVYKAEVRSSRSIQSSISRDQSETEEMQLFEQKVKDKDRKCLRAPQGPCLAPSQRSRHEIQVSVLSFSFS